MLKTRDLVAAVLVILLILIAAWYWRSSKSEGMCGGGGCGASCSGCGNCRFFPGAGSYSAGVGGPLPVQTEQILGGALPMQGTHYGAPRQPGTGSCGDYPCNGMDYNGCKGGYQGDKYIRGTTYSMPPSRGAVDEAETIVALNGGDMTPGANMSNEKLTPGPQNIWSQASTYGPTTQGGAGTFPYASYSGYRQGLSQYETGGPSRASHSLTYGAREGYANPQYEWDQKSTYGPTTSDTTYPYDSYSGFHEGVYPTFAPLDDSHHW